MSLWRRIMDRVTPVGARMKRDWEARARENAMHYVADFKPHWDDPEEFFRTGLDDTERFLAEAGWSATDGLRLLEIGCGVGRMTRHLAERFAHVTAIDISPTMIAEARRLNGHIANAEFREGSGTDLAGLPDASFDRVMSYIVFQHIPDSAVILGYIREALRVMKPDGEFRFQARNDMAHRVTDTYNGAGISLDAVRAIAEERGLRVHRVSGEGTHYCYMTISR